MEEGWCRMEDGVLPLALDLWHRKLLHCRLLSRNSPQEHIVGTRVGVNGPAKLNCVQELLAHDRFQGVVRQICKLTHI